MHDASPSTARPALPGFPTPPPTRHEKRLLTAPRASARERKREREQDAAAKKSHFYDHAAPPASPLEKAWRHSYWAEKRELVHAALQSTGTTELALHNFAQCGSMCACQWSESLQKRRLSAWYCHSRHCEPCARSKANRIAGNLRDRLKDPGSNQFRLLTFTIKHSDAPLADQLKKLTASFRKLRACQMWKDTQKGGAVILEVKWTGKAWHPHYHCVAEGAYIDKYALSKAWHKATGDSFVVDVRKLDRAQDAAHYVCKYITKSTSDSVWSTPSVAQEYVTAMKGVRTCGTFGSWRKWPLTKAVARATDWQHEDTLENIVRRASTGEIAAQHILNDLRRDGGALDSTQAVRLLPPSSPACTPDDFDLPPPAD